MYDYIRRAYGLDYQRGDLVALNELGAIHGLVLSEKPSSGHYVHVEFSVKGKKQRGLFHPTSITKVPA